MKRTVQLPKGKSLLLDSRTGKAHIVDPRRIELLEDNRSNLPGYYVGKAIGKPFNVFIRVAAGLTLGIVKGIAPGIGKKKGKEEEIQITIEEPSSIGDDYNLEEEYYQSPPLPPRNI